MNLDDTIVAIATPPGRGGIGVVRLSGPEARAIALPMLRLKHELEAGHAVFGELVEPGGGAEPCPVVTERSSADRIDEVVVTYFAKPHSYTTDDIIEISSHSSPIVLRHVVELALARGARLAEPGEFTMRAFLNGRIDLTQAEAVRDLIDSQTLYQAKVAAQQLEGEAGIDFAEDDISVLPTEQIVQRIATIRGPLEELAATFAYGKIVHEGLTLAIVGRPNVGKSSLFNRLVERERAIVTATPGTTRDLISETVALGGIPVRLVDTAGIRRALDEAESIGIRKSMEAIAGADLVLIVLDSSQPVTEEDTELLEQGAKRPAIVVENKADLSSFPTSVLGSQLPRVRTSAITGEGIGGLRNEILRHIGGETGVQAETGFVTSLRHQSLIREAITALDAAQAAVRGKIPHEMILLDLYNALRQLDEITGATATDDILNLIFSTFCIGK
ncbi:MAG: tRNA uridine-5-carboxymethylaminomethyl(34) synthesis GTPase MnmE [Acidobacteriales bacterium 13_1_40CM_3_55_5]|nr:MAG: tRNA uridine-5-carboxymethylaminomethyl(34) synthesis GTPase MnmE [Acidobacteriales bacterium 13_1_40CM_3_55_5]